MAATLTPSSELTFYSFPITKTEEADDGSGDLIVWGKASDGTLDSDLQIVDPAWSAKALQEWYDTGGNVRVQHQAQRDPAGRGIDIRPSPDGTWVKTRVVEPVAVKLVKAGVLQDYSVGIMNPDVRVGDPRFRHLDPAGKAVNGVITGRDDGMSKIGELSLVDRGSNFGTKFSLVKAAADGTPEWVGEVTAPDEVLASVGESKAGKTVTLTLPKNMPVSVKAGDLARLTHGPKPSDLAKLDTLGKRLATGQAALSAPAVLNKAGSAQEAPEKAAAASPGDVIGERTDDALKAVGAAEAAILGKKHREFSADERREQASQGHSLPDGSYPVPDADALRRAAILARSGHGDAAAAKKLIARRARELGVPNPLKGGKDKADKSAKPPAKCGTCDGSGMNDSKPCGDCKAGRKKAAAMKKEIAKALAPAAPDVAKKKRRACGSCGAMQNKEHKFCTECSKPMSGAMPVEKNHDHMCLGCGKALDKGERFCPGCGKEHPGYLPEADQKIPANQDKAAAKGRVTEKRKGGKTEKRPVPGEGAAGQHEKPAARHREPDGAEVERFEHDARMEDGDQSSPGEKPAHLEAGTLKGSADPEIQAALAMKALGVSPQEGAIHALTCPAYSPDVARAAFPSASFAGLDLSPLQETALAKAAGGSMAEMQSANGLLQAAMALRSADPFELADLAEAAHKSFRDANPGPATFPAPGQISAERFRRPLMEAGHAASSPGHEPPRMVAPPPAGGIQPGDYARGFLADGRAADSPANSHQAGPMPVPEHTGVPTSAPARQYYRNSAREQAEHAMRIVHDHIAASHPDLCPMHGGDHVASRPVPVPQGTPSPASAPTGKKGGKKARKAARTAEAKAARVLEAKRQKLAGRVLSGKLSLEDAQAKLGITPAADKAAGTATALPEADAITAAVTQATAPLAAALAKSLKAQGRQDKRLRKLARVTDSLADSPDTSAAPHRGVTAVKTAGALAAPLHAGPAVPAQDPMLPYLYDTWRNDPDPGRQEAAWAEMRKRTWDKSVQPMTPDQTGQQAAYAYPLPT